MSGNRILIDMDDTLVDYTGAFNLALTLCPKISYPQSQLDFFRNLQPLPNAVETVLWLYDWFEVWIATAPSIKNPLCYTEKRVSIERHFGLSMAERLIICPDKSLLIADVLIDDMNTGRGQDRFAGQHIHFGSEDWKDWKTIRKYFEEIT